MAATFTLRLNDEFMKKIETRAKQKNKSRNQLITELLTFGSLIEDLTDDDSKIVIRHAKGYEAHQEVIVPNPDQLYA